jgi:hypothetical protein
MLYDPKWEVQADTKLDPMAYDTFVGWLEKQPHNKRYCYLDHGACLVASYLTAMGFKSIEVFSCGAFTHRIGNQQISAAYPQHLDGIAVHEPHTYRAALERAKSPEFIW